MRIFVGFVIGCIIGYFILPDNLLYMSLASLTVGDVARIIGSFLAVFFCSGVGAIFQDV